MPRSALPDVSPTHGVYATALGMRTQLAKLAHQLVQAAIWARSLIAME